jgi:hypothetical protein
MSSRRLLGPLSLTGLRWRQWKPDIQADIPVGQHAPEKGDVQAESIEFG